MSKEINLSQFQLDRSLILATPTNLTGAELFKWQEFCTQTISDLASLDFQPELIWINDNLTSILMDDIRAQIAQLQFGVALNSHRLVFILAADQASIQVQNTLLKILEEPPARTTLILVTPNPASLIPTILSRCRIIQYSETETDFIQTPDLIQDLATLTNFSLQPENYSFGQLSLLASKYKDKTLAKNFITSWLNQLTPNLATASSNQLKLAKLCLNFQDWLTQNLNPVLALEELFFTIKKTAI